MRRIIALLMAFLMVSLPVFPGLAQSSSYRIPTQADQQDFGPAPSFRGGERLPVRVPGNSQGFGSGTRTGIRVPPETPSIGTTGSSVFGDAAMMSMGYQVHVLGEVMQPGTYRVMASDRLSEVILRAGGIAENGSERNIELRRKGGGVQHVDLLGFSLFGRLEGNPYVSDNDVIFVPLRDKVVQVVGAAKRPDIYELKNERTLENVIELAGGFNAAASMDKPIRIIRFKGGQKNVEEIPIQADALKSFAVQNGDVIVVPNLLTKDTEFDYNVASIPGDQIFYPSYEDRVFVLGGVAFPGAYPFSPYYMVNQYISLAGGVNDRGTNRCTVTSIDGKTRKAKANDRVNPGDTIAVKQRWMNPAAWAGFALSIASFGLSASSTIIALQRR